MKKIVNRLYALLFASVAFSTVSCSEDAMDLVNKDIDHPIEVPSRFIITEVENNFAINVAGGDLSFYALSYVEQEVGIFNQLHAAEVRSNEPSSSSTYNNSWDGIYFNMESLRQIIALCSEGGKEVGNTPTLGMAQTLTALHLGVLTDCFGDVPWSEALKLSQGILQPKLDKQEAIYADILKLLDDAIANLAVPSSSAAASVGNQDFIYGGDVKLWTKFAYSLKARYLMRLSHVKPDYNAVLAAVEKGFESAKDEAKLSFFDDNANVSPYSAFFLSRDYMGASKSFIEKLEARGDIRAKEFVLIDPNKKNTYNKGLAPNGEPLQTQEYYNLPASAYDGAAPVYLSSYHELMFIKTEALQRKNAPQAEVKEAFKTAFLAAAAKHAGILDRTTKIGSKLTPAVATALFEGKITELFVANPLNEILLQKYIGLYQDGEALEAYNDVRRNMAMGNNVYDFKNKNKKFPLRYTYGSSDVTTNPNVRAAYGQGEYVYSEPVWWAGGSR